MFDYQVSKHPHFDEACRAFALRHNLVQLAERAGMNVQILRNKLNPAQPHLLTAPEIWLLTDLTEDSTLVDGFLAQIHCLPCVPINEVAKEKLPHYVMSATAEIGRVAAGAVSAISEVNAELYEFRRRQQMLGYASLAEVPAEQLDGKSERIQHYFNAVYCWARAMLNERYQDYDATASGVKRGEELAEASGDLWRDARWAISRVQDAPHCTVELI